MNPATGEVIWVKEHSVVGHINQYPESYTSSKRPDPHYMCQVGDFITGEVVQRKVQPYTTEKGFTINYYNAVVFGDSTRSDWEERIRNTFEREGRTLIPDNTHTSFEIIKDQIMNLELMNEFENMEVSLPEEPVFYMEDINSFSLVPSELNEKGSPIIPPQFRKK